MRTLYDKLRMPKIVVAQDGSILAFADGCTVLRRSQDQGATWSEAVEVNPEGNANAIVDETNGDILLVCPKPSCQYRSRNPSYGCNAGLVRVPPEATGGQDILIYSAPDNPGRTEPFNGRIRMTLRVSTDGARTWPVKHLVHDGISVYSSVTADRQGNVYLLFESGEEALYESLVLVQTSLPALGVNLT